MDKLATPEEVADVLGVSIGTLANWAYRGRGPKFVKVEHLRRYRWSDVADYLRAREVNR